MVALTVYFESSPGTPLTGPTGDDIPEVTIVDDQDTVTQAATDGTELVNQPGFYEFDFTTFVAARVYTVRWDGDPDNNGQVPAASRFHTLTVSGQALVNHLTTIPTNLDAQVSSRATQADILNDATPFAGANIDAAISSRAAPGDAMDLVAGAVDAAAIATDAIDADAIAADAIGSSELATSAVNEIRDAILSDSTPFAGANIDAAISSRAAPGDAMDLVAGAVDAAAIATDAIDADALAADAVAEIADGVWDEPVAGHQTAGTFGRNATSIAQEGTVSGGASSTSVPTSITGLGDDFLNNLQVIFFDGSGNPVARNVDDYTSATGTFTVADLGFTPAAASVVIVLRRTGSSAVDTASIADAVWDEATAGHVAGGSFGLELQNKAEPGDAMDLVANAVDAASLATSAVDEIADQVWEEAIADHSGTAGSTAEALDNAATGASPSAIADAVWDEAIAGHLAGGSTGASLNSKAVAGDAMDLVTGALDSDALATSAVDEIADGVWDEAIAGHSGAGSAGLELQNKAEPGDEMDLQANAIDAAAFAVDAIEADALDSTAVEEIADQVWNEAVASHVSAGSFGLEVQNKAEPGDQMDLINDAVDSASLATSAVDEISDGVWDEPRAGHATAGTFGESVNLDAAGLATDAVEEIADQVWDEPIAGHLGVGSTGEALNDAATGASPAVIADAVWDEPLAGHTAAGSAAQALQDIEDVTVMASGLVTAGGNSSEVRSDIIENTGSYDGMYIVVRNTSSGRNVIRRIDEYQNLNGAFFLDEPLPFTPAVNDPVFVIGGAGHSAVFGGAK